MKKRKPPVVLATILVVLVVGVGIVYAPRGSSEPEQQQQPTPPPETQERPKVSTSEASDAIKSMMKSGGGSPQDKMPSGGPHVIGQDNGSSVKVMKAPAGYKPMPNDSSISSQWYTPETKK